MFKEILEDEEEHHAEAEVASGTGRDSRSFLQHFEEIAEVVCPAAYSSGIDRVPRRQCLSNGTMREERRRSRQHYPIAVQTAIIVFLRLDEGA